MDRSKKILYGGIAAVVVITLVVIVAWPRNGGKATCAPNADKPDVKGIKIENLASTDSTILANLAGYVELIGEKGNTYLPLDISSLNFKDSDVKTMTFAGECVSFVVSYAAKKDAKANTSSYDYSEFDMELRKENAEKAEVICTFDKPFVFSQPTTERYSCTKEQSHQCSTLVDKKQQPVANLVLKSFEMEFERTKDAKSGDFAKKPWDQSCSKWDK